MEQWHNIIDTIIIIDENGTQLAMNASCSNNATESVMDCSGIIRTTKITLCTIVNT